MITQRHENNDKSVREKLNNERAKASKKQQKNGISENGER
jgi:hypothetical protein